MFSGPRFDVAVRSTERASEDCQYRCAAGFGNMRKAKQFIAHVSWFLDLLTLSSPVANRREAALAKPSLDFCLN